MSTMPPPEAFDSVLDEHLSPVARQRRRDTRRAFYAMVLEDLDRGRMTRRRRAQLRHYGRELGIDPLEIQLLMSGAEYRSGYRPRSGLLQPVAGEQAEFLLSPETPPAGLASLVMTVLIWVISFGLLWVAMAR